jgi:predicted transcriptional regulator
MLKASLLAITKTRLMMRTGLNYPNFVGYFTELLEEGLLEQVPTPNGKALYRITKEGKELLKSLQQAQRRIEL